jgi:UDP-glucose 4-epimerase
MRVLLTGGAGFIGKHILVDLIKSDFQVEIIDNFHNSNPAIIKQVQKIIGREPEVHKGDIRDNSFMQRVFETFLPEAVIHLAGIKSVAESINDPLEYYDVNVNGTLQLLSIMSHFNCEKIIFSSSATVYGSAKYLPINECHPLDPQNPYGRSKLMVEEILRDWVKSSPSNRAICLRYFNPIGAHPSGMIGENPTGVPNNLMPYILGVALGNFKFLKIFGDDYETRDGTGERDYIHVCDLARSHVLALREVNNLASFDIFNVGTGFSVSVKELVEIFEKVTSIKIPRKISSRRSGDIAKSFADCSKIEKVLEFKCQYDLTDMCEHSWKWQSMQRQEGK